MDEFEPGDRSAADLVAAHRRRYAAALEFGPHAAPWKRDPQIATALAAQDLTAEELARLLTQVSCAHQVSRLTDLQELSADAAANLSRLSEQWDAGNQPPLERTQLARAIAELVALDSYLSLLQAVPPQNTQVALAHWSRLEPFLPVTQLRQRLETIVEYEVPQPRPAMATQPHGTIR